MIWLYLYLTIGLLTVLVMVTREMLQPKDAAKLSAAIRKDGPAKYSARWLLVNVIYKIVGFVLLVLCWPLGWYMWIEERFTQWRRKRREETTKFRVRKKDLVAKMTVEEVEAVERVHDPMGAVPDVPYGHLNHVWLEFLSKRPTGAELWSFATGWEDYWGSFHDIRGHVWVTSERNAPWIIKEKWATGSADY